MRNFTFVAALLCTASWISVSVSEILTVEVQPGEEVKLMCNNFTSLQSNVFWYRLSSEQNVSCISSMSSSDSNVSLYEEFKNGNFIMRSNNTNLFLNIKNVNVSDSGLYFCGCCRDGLSALVSPTYLKVQEVSDELTNQTIVIMGGLIIILVIVIIGLVVTIRKCHTAQDEEPNPQHNELQNFDSDTLNYAPLSFHPKMEGTRRPQRTMETNVVYAATR